MINKLPEHVEPSRPWPRPLNRKTKIAMIKSPDEIYCYERNLQENRDQFISYAEWLEIRYNEMLEALIEVCIYMEKQDKIISPWLADKIVFVEGICQIIWEEIKANK